MKHVIADTHFDHAKLVQLAGYPFAGVEEMNETLIANWNSVVKPGDIVYHIGDFGLGKNLRRIYDRLNGQISLIRGNHDLKNIRYMLSVFHSVHDILDTKLCGWPTVMCHYPFETWNRSHYGSYHLHGHCHGNLPAKGRRLDGGANCNNWTPLSEEYIHELLKDRPFEHHHKGGPDDHGHSVLAR